MLTEFDAIARGEITDAEFEAARRSLDHSYRQALDNPAALSSFYAKRALIGNTETIDSFRQAVARVTKEEIVTAAQHVSKGATFFLKGNLSEEEDEE